MSWQRVITWVSDLMSAARLTPAWVVKLGLTQVSLSITAVGQAAGMKAKAVRWKGWGQKPTPFLKVGGA
jgi:hypothetical protein